MPNVDGKEFPYTKKGKMQAIAAKMAKKKTPGYGPNPADGPIVNEDGIRQLENQFKMSKTAMDGKDKAKKNAKRARSSYSPIPKSRTN